MYTQLFRTIHLKPEKNSNSLHPIMQSSDQYWNMVWRAGALFTEGYRWIGEGATQGHQTSVSSDKTAIHKWKLEKRMHISSQVRQKWFANWVINPWNSLPSSVVNAPSIKVFKTRLDEYQSFFSLKQSMKTIKDYFIWKVWGLIRILNPPIKMN